MLSDSKLVGFLATTDYNKAREFYEGKLGLRFVSQDDFALVLHADGNTIRIPRVTDFRPQPFTVLGWEVSDIQSKVKELAGRGVQFERYGFAGQDELGIWSSPAGAKVAWFKDPDGNVLSMSESA